MMMVSRTISGAEVVATGALALDVKTFAEEALPEAFKDGCSRRHVGQNERHQWSDQPSSHQV